MSRRKSKKAGVKAAREWYGEHDPQHAEAAEREVRGLFQTVRKGPKKPPSDREYFRLFRV